MPLRSAFSKFLLLVLLLSSTSVPAAPFCHDLFKVRQPMEIEGPLEGRRPIPRKARFFEAVLAGERVFVKPLRGDSKAEAHWLSRINQLGLGVKLKGITRIEDKLHLVTEFAEGFNTNEVMFAAVAKAFPHEEVLKEMKRQFEVLIENGILPVDLQFQISLDGKSVKIVDVESFTFKVGSPRGADLIWKNIEMNYRSNLMD